MSLPQCANISKLERLHDSGLTLADDAQDIRGRHVTDITGTVVGLVSGLFIDVRLSGSWRSPRADIGV